MDDDRVMGASQANGLSSQEPVPVSAVPASIPSADLLTFDLPQRLVLDRMDGELGYPFRDIASDCGLAEADVRRIIHHFHARAMTGFGPLFNEDDGHICGKGYWLSRYGSNLQRQMRELLGQRTLWAMRDAAQGMAARSDATGTGAAEGNSPVGAADAPGGSHD